MVVGSGLLASAFKSYTSKDDIIIFASGVSNSKCTDPKQFQREINLVESFKDSSKLFIYFSTSSVDDPFIGDSSYIRHKLDVEEFVRANFQKYLIVRLPNVVGFTKNSNTLTNYIYNSVCGNLRIELQENANRYLIDVDDIYLYINGLILNEPDLNLTVNLIVAEKCSVLNIVNCFEVYLGKTIEKVILKNQGGNYTLHLDPIFKKHGLVELRNGEEYLNEILRKYYFKNN